MIPRKAAVFLIGACCSAGVVVMAGRAQANDDCSYRGTTYSDGAAMCQSGTQFRCKDGQWKKTGNDCVGTGNPVEGAKGCDYKGTPYSTGAATCQAGTEYRCDDGMWKSLSVPCTSSGDVPVVAPSRPVMYNGATVASNSSICKAGVMFLCVDGEWRNLGTACQ